MKTSTIAIIAVIIIVLAGGAYVLTRDTDESTTDSTTNQTTTADTTTRSSTANESTETSSVHTIAYTNSGFTPSSLGPVAPGTTVTFVNESNEDVRVASAVHPTHDELPGFDSLGAIEPGGSYQFTFEEVGSWTFHNHLNESETGVVVVAD